MNQWRILQGDARERMADLDAGSVRCCVTSPPYWGLRDYGVSGQLGLESTPEAYVAAMVAVFADVRRVLTDDATLWLNLGDSYAPVNRGENARPRAETLTGMQVGNPHADIPTRRDVIQGVQAMGIKQKDLVGIPWMVAFALRADGWYLRSDIIWSKPNPMPESVTDRPTKAHEYIFLLSKSRSYYYDAAAIREPYAESTQREIAEGYSGQATKDYDGTGAQNPSDTKRRIIEGARRKMLSVPGQTQQGRAIDNPWREEVRDGSGRNKRSVWNVATHPYPDAHFATFPEALIEPCIKAGSAHGDTILDPFTGSGTTGAVAIRHQRNFIGTELNPAYVELARKRINAVAPMFAQEVA
jgi:DNA modification methylase